MPQALLLVQIATTWAMTGIIWFVQLVQYPSFVKVDANAFVDFHSHHSTAITVIVAPLMVLELASAVALLGFPLRFQSAWQVWLGIALLAVIWGSTFLLQVPAHVRLASGFDHATWQALVSSNWIRTTAWSARAGLVTTWAYRAFVS